MDQYADFGPEFMRGATQNVHILQEMAVNAGP
jgi:hypothetical protein